MSVLAEDWKDTFTGWGSAVGCFRVLHCWSWLLERQTECSRECGGGGHSVTAGTLELWALWAPTESCRWLFAMVVWSVQLLCPQPLLKPTELLLPRLSWHCFPLLLVLPDYLHLPAMCLPTCCESSALHFCQHKQPACVNFCLPLNAWARFSLNPRTIYMFRHIAVFLKDILVQKKTWQIQKLTSLLGWGQENEVGTVQQLR